MSDESFTLTSEAAKELSQLGAAKGGDARALKLSPERRSEIARQAVEARWAKAGKEPVPVATHGSPDRPLRIANVELQAYVLSDGTRVLSQAGFLEALGRHRKANVRRKWAEERVPPILQGKAINEFISKEILEKSRPIKFRTPHGVIASGYRADLLPDVCEIYLKAREAGKLPTNQSHVAKQAEILIRGLANVGIIALVDEATGYQDDRAKDALARILERFIAKELRPYVKTFPTAFYKEMFRLRNWKWPELPADQRKRPILVGNLTDNVVYDRLAPGVKQRLKELIGRDETGRLKKKMFQRLTEEIGDPKLREHLASVVALMKAADSWPQFIEMIDRALPKYKPLPLFDDLKELRA
jgi:hypothetical protein